MVEITYNTFILTALISTQCFLPIWETHNSRNMVSCENSPGDTDRCQHKAETVDGVWEDGGGAVCVHYLAHNTSVLCEKWVHKPLCAYAWKVVFKLLSLMEIALKLRWEMWRVQRGLELKGFFS